MTSRRARLSLLAAAIAAGVVVSPGAAGAVMTPVAEPAGPTVTLLTGDRVTVGGTAGVNVRAAKGREHIAFHTRTDVRGDTHVIPDDAIAPLARGKLDPRLFNVTGLVEAGYDDASRDRLPLIVDYPGQMPRTASTQVTRDLPAMGAAAVSVARTTDFWATAGQAEHVWLDGPVQASLDRSVLQIGAPEAWAAGYTGAGETVAVLDTGIDATHPDLSDAIAGEQNFTDSTTTDDRFGHGTHVASIITGSGGKYQGVAPDAKLLNGKVLNDDGEGYDSWIIAGMEWAAGGDADLVNMSLGSRMSSDGTDPISQALDRLTAETGTLFVVSSGNTGGQVTSPGAAAAALTVGAVDRTDELAGFSSRGHVNGVIKPDLVGPGVDIVAAKAANGRIGDPVDENHVSMSGTSMAAPHVAGAAAILAERHPDWGAGQLKAALVGTAKPNGTSSVFEQGAGRADIGRAATATVFPSAASLSLGTAQWPHADDQPITKHVTYTNTGGTAVTLDLAAEVSGPDGSPAPQGMFTVEPARLTVPAGGAATVAITADTRVEAADGVYSGALTATGGDQSVRTPIAVTREAESYNVTVKAIDHNGAPTGNYYLGFVDVHARMAHSGHDPSGTVVVRMPKGEFYASGYVSTDYGQGSFKHTEFSEPVFMVTGDTEIVLDAREGRPAGFTVDKPNAKVGNGRFTFEVNTDWGRLRSTSFIPDYDNFLFKPSTTQKKDRVIFIADARLGEWNGTSFQGSYLYHLRHKENGSIPANLRWRFRDSELAKVRSTHAAANPGVVGFRENFLVVPLPATLTEYYTPNEPWDGQFIEMIDPATYDMLSVVDQIRPRSFPLDRTTTERWNTGVFGPALPNGLNEKLYFAARIGNNLRFVVPMFTDQGRGRAGAGNAEGGTILLRDGEVVGEYSGPGLGLFEVGPERAEYTLRTTGDRSGFARLSTQVSTEWTFASEYAPEDDPALLPLLAVRFAPNLDADNTAPAARRFTIPIHVQRNGSDSTRGVHTPAVEVSYDDGKTWRPAGVQRDRDDWKATVDHPAGAKFVSLRSSVTDADGNAQRLTIIRAYALR